MPLWVDFGQWILERRHPDLDRLYTKPPGLIAELVKRRELEAELLDAFNDPGGKHRIHGQVTAGWLRAPRADGTSAQIAVTFQILSSARRGGRRLALNLIAAGPDGEPLEHLAERLAKGGAGRVPWTPVVAWATSALRSIEADARQASGKKGKQSKDGKDGKQGKDAKGARFEQRVAGVLDGIARRLSHDHRARGRRTDHAEARHDQGDRPTRMALADLARADDARVLRDVRRKTWIVLGERGRAHVFNPAGRLVTSIRYSPESIERKRRAGIWRPAQEGDAAELRAKVEKGDAVDGDEVR